MHRLVRHRALDLSTPSVFLCFGPVRGTGRLSRVCIAYQQGIAPTPAGRHCSCPVHAPTAPPWSRAACSAGSPGPEHRVCLRCLGPWHSSCPGRASRRLGPIYPPGCRCQSTKKTRCRGTPSCSVTPRALVGVQHRRRGAEAPPSGRNDAVTPRTTYDERRSSWATGSIPHVPRPPSPGATTASKAPPLPPDALASTPSFRGRTVHHTRGYRARSLCRTGCPTAAAANSPYHRRRASRRCSRGRCPVLSPSAG